MLESLSLDGKSIAITGGGTGLGLAMVRALGPGWRRPRHCWPTFQVPSKQPPQKPDHWAGKPSPFPPTSPTRPRSMPWSKGRSSGSARSTYLINNAGAVQDNVRKPIWDITDEEWSRIMDVNLTGAFYCSRAVSRPMVDQGHGKIVNVASGFGMRGGRDIYMYCCSKGGMVQLTRVLSFNLRPLWRHRELHRSRFRAHRRYAELPPRACRAPAISSPSAN